MTTVALLEADLLLVDEPTAEIDEEESGGERHQPALA
jgi:energy-coupling factor transporter ATP-binding protein EcfA2